VIGYLALLGIGAATAIAWPFMGLAM
jgi:hypothetical protein